MDRSVLSWSRLRWLVPGLLAGGVYLALKTRDLMPDSLAHALAARQGAGLTHPHHLIYGLAVRGVHDLLSALGAPDAVLAGQLHNLVWVVVAACALGLLLSRVTGRPGLALLGVGLLLASRGVWVYATEVEVYVPAAAALLVLVTLQLWAARRGFDRCRGLALAGGAALAAATLYHQSAVLMVLPLAAGTWVAAGRAGLRWAAVVIGVGAAVVLPAYVAAWAATPDAGPGAQGFIRYCLAYGWHPNPDWGSWAHLAPAGWLQLLRSHLWTVAAVTSAPARGVGTVVVGLVLVGLIAETTIRLWRGRRRRQRGDTPRVGLRVIALTWLVTSDLFFLWWLPREREFFIAQLVPLTILLVLCLDDLTRGRSGGGHHRWAWAAGAAAVLALAGVNVRAAVWPRHLERGPHHRRAARLDARAPRGCLIAADFSAQAQLQYYFHRRHTLEIALPQLLIYQDRPVPRRLQVRGFGCVLVSSYHLLPGYTINGFSGRTHPHRWRRFIAWLFDLRRDSAGSWQARAATTSGPDVRGFTLVRLRHRRVPAAGTAEALLEGLLARSRR